MKSFANHGRKILSSAHRGNPRARSISIQQRILVRQVIELPGLGRPHGKGVMGQFNVRVLTKVVKHHQIQGVFRASPLARLAQITKCQLYSVRNDANVHEGCQDGVVDQEFPRDLLDFLASLLLDDRCGFLFIL